MSTSSPTMGMQVNLLKCDHKVLLPKSREDPYSFVTNLLESVEDLAKHS